MYTLNPRSNNDRFASHYRERQTNIPEQQTEIDFINNSNYGFNFGYEAVIDNDYSLVVKNRDEIINLLSSDDYDKINKLIETMNSPFYEPIYWSDSDWNEMSTNRDNNNDDDDADEYESEPYMMPASMINSTIMNASSSPLSTNVSKKRALNKLIRYCYSNKDIDLLKILVTKSDTESNSVFLLLVQIDPKANTYDITNQEIFKAFIEHINYTEHNIDTIISNIILLNTNVVVYLDIMNDLGYCMNDNHIKTAIFNNKIKVIQYAILYSGRHNYNMQKIVDSLFNREIADGEFDPEHLRNVSCSNTQTLKLLIDNGIDLSKVQNNVFWTCITNGDLDTVIFLYEMFTGSLVGINITYGLTLACQKNNIDIMIYLLKCGASINSIPSIIVFNVKFKTYKFLIDNGYLLPQSSQIVANLHLLRCFVNDQELDNVNYLIKNGSSVEWLIDNDILKTYKDYDMMKQNMLFRNDWDMVRSPLEFIVTSNKISHIKFLVDNYFTLMKLHLNRLFIIACANGRTLLAEYLLDYGATLSYKSLVSACFFGHLEIVILLLKRGLTFSSSSTGDDNVFNMTIYGKLCSMHNVEYFTQSMPDDLSPTFYNNLIKDDDTFRNDIYNFGSDHSEILKMIIADNCRISTEQNNLFVSNLGTLTEEFYDIDILKYFTIDENIINSTYKVFNAHYYEREKRTLLESSIVYKKLDVIEYLLQKGASSPINNNTAIIAMNSNMLIKNMLTKYGIVYKTKY